MNRKTRLPTVLVIFPTVDAHMNEFIYVHCFMQDLSLSDAEMKMIVKRYRKYIVYANN